MDIGIYRQEETTTDGRAVVEDAEDAEQQGLALSGRQVAVPGMLAAAPVDADSVRARALVFGTKAVAVSSNKPLTSKFRGVCWNKKNKRWQAAINSSGKYLYLGSYDTEAEAAAVFDKAAIRIRGLKARLNFCYSDYVDDEGRIRQDPAIDEMLQEANQSGKPPKRSRIAAVGGGGGGGGRAHSGANSDGDSPAEHRGGGGGGGFNGLGASPPRRQGPRGGGRKRREADTGDSSWSEGEDAQPRRRRAVGPGGGGAFGSSGLGAGSGVGNVRRVGGGVGARRGGGDTEPDLAAQMEALAAGGGLPLLGGFDLGNLGAQGQGLQLVGLPIQLQQQLLQQQQQQRGGLVDLGGIADSGEGIVLHPLQQLAQAVTLSGGGGLGSGIGGLDGVGGGRRSAPGQPPRLPLHLSAQELQQQQWLGIGSGSGDVPYDAADDGGGGASGLTAVTHSQLRELLSLQAAGANGGLGDGGRDQYDPPDPRAAPPMQLQLPAPHPLDRFRARRASGSNRGRAAADSDAMLGPAGSALLALQQLKAGGAGGAGAASGGGGGGTESQLADLLLTVVGAAGSGDAGNGQALQLEPHVHRPLYGASGGVNGGRSLELLQELQRRGQAPANGRGGGGSAAHGLDLQFVADALAPPPGRSGPMRYETASPTRAYGQHDPRRAAGGRSAAGPGLGPGPPPRDPQALRDVRDIQDAAYEGHDVYDHHGMPLSRARDRDRGHGFAGQPPLHANIALDQPLSLRNLELLRGAHEHALQRPSQRPPPPPPLHASSAYHDVQLRARLQEPQQPHPHHPPPPPSHYAARGHSPEREEPAYRANTHSMLNLQRPRQPHPQHGPDRDYQHQDDHHSRNHHNLSRHQHEEQYPDEPQQPSAADGAARPPPPRPRLDADDGSGGGSRGARGGASGGGGGYVAPLLLTLQPDPETDVHGAAAAVVAAAAQEEAAADRMWGNSLHSLASALSLLTGAALRCDEGLQAGRDAVGDGADADAAATGPGQMVAPSRHRSDGGPEWEREERRDGDGAPSPRRGSLEELEGAGAAVAAEQQQQQDEQPPPRLALPEAEHAAGQLDVPGVFQAQQHEQEDQGQRRLRSDALPMEGATHGGLEAEVAADVQVQQRQALQHPHHEQQQQQRPVAEPLRLEYAPRALEAGHEPADAAGDGGGAAEGTVGTAIGGSPQGRTMLDDAAPTLSAAASAAADPRGGAADAAHGGNGAVSSHCGVGAAATVGGGSGGGAAAGSGGDLVSTIVSALPAGAAIDSIVPSPLQNVLGVLYRLGGGSTDMCAAVWNGRVQRLRLLGEFPSEGQAKAACQAAFAMLLDNEVAAGGAGGMGSPPSVLLSSGGGGSGSGAGARGGAAGGSGGLRSGAASELPQNAASGGGAPGADLAPLLDLSGIPELRAVGSAGISSGPGGDGGRGVDPSQDRYYASAALALSSLGGLQMFPPERSEGGVGQALRLAPPQGRYGAGGGAAATAAAGVAGSPPASAAGRVLRPVLIGHLSGGAAGRYGSADAGGQQHGGGGGVRLAYLGNISTQPDPRLDDYGGSPAQRGGGRGLVLGGWGGDAEAEATDESAVMDRRAAVRQAGGRPAGTLAPALELLGGVAGGGMRRDGGSTGGPRAAHYARGPPPYANDPCYGDEGAGAGPPVAVRGGGGGLGGGSGGSLGGGASWLFGGGGDRGGGGGGRGGSGGGLGGGGGGGLSALTQLANMDVREALLLLAQQQQQQQHRR